MLIREEQALLARVTALETWQAKVQAMIDEAEQIKGSTEDDLRPSQPIAETQASDAPDNPIAPISIPADIPAGIDDMHELGGDNAGN